MTESYIFHLRPKTSWKCYPYQYSYNNEVKSDPYSLIYILGYFTHDTEYIVQRTVIQNFLQLFSSGNDHNIRG
jgi:hypothetical protein